VGLPLEGIGLILALDRLLDMGRTTVNVWGDVSGAAIYYGLEQRAAK
jgi:Na+/H+-dicarboxylate symporter